MTIIDSQVHAYEANTPKRPGTVCRTGPITHRRRDGGGDGQGRLDGAIFISSFSMYRYDAAMPWRWHGPIRAGWRSSSRSIDNLMWPTSSPTGRRRGTVGIRIMLPKESGRDPNDPGLDRFLRAAVRHDFPVNMPVLGQSGRGQRRWIDPIPIRASFSTISASCNHASHPGRQSRGLTCRRSGPGQKRRNVVIKVSGACTLSREP